MAMCLIFGMACLLSRWCAPVSRACLGRYAKDARNARMLTLAHDRGVLPLGRLMPRTVHALALVSALCSAGATILIRQGLRGRGPYTGFWINLVVGTVGLWAAVLLTGGFGHPSAAGVAFFVLAGLIGTVAGRLLRFGSIDKVGASVAASLINLHPLVATGVALPLLCQRVTAPILAGTVVIVLGTTLLSVGGPRTGVRPWQITLPPLAAPCLGVVAVLGKLGLSGTGAVLGSALKLPPAPVAFTRFLPPF